MTTVATFACKRCGYTTKYKHVLVTHLERKNVCQPKLNDANVEDLLKELAQNDKKYKCVCGLGYSHTASLYRHKLSCLNAIQLQQRLDAEKVAQKYPANTSSTNSTDLNWENTQQKLHKLELELMYYKNKKNESFYQLMMESILDATHKTLPMGVTDITTDTKHVEIKDWKCWKEALGQLMYYNTADPKDGLEVYFFGQRPRTAPEVFDVFKKHNITPFEFVHQENGVVSVRDTNGEVVYTYKPQM